jgi:hypothetical protein
MRNAQPHTKSARPRRPLPVRRWRVSPEPQWRRPPSNPRTARPNVIGSRGDRNETSDVPFPGPCQNQDFRPLAGSGSIRADATVRDRHCPRSWIRPKQLVSYQVFVASGRCPSRLVRVRCLLCMSAGAVGGASASGSDRDVLASNYLRMRSSRRGRITHAGPVKFAINVRVSSCSIARPTLQRR